MNWTLFWEFKCGPKQERALPSHVGRRASGVGPRPSEARVRGNWAGDEAWPRRRVRARPSETGRRARRWPKAERGTAHGRRDAGERPDGPAGEAWPKRRDAREAGPMDREALTGLLWGRGRRTWRPRGHHVGPRGGEVGDRIGRPAMHRGVPAYRGGLEGRQAPTAGEGDGESVHRCGSRGEDATSPGGGARQRWPWPHGEGTREMGGARGGAPGGSRAIQEGRPRGKSAGGGPSVARGLGSGQRRAS